MALLNTFKLIVCFLIDIGLKVGSTIAIDVTNVKALNSKKNNHTLKKLEWHLEYIENIITEYDAQLDSNDASKTTIPVEEG